MKVKMKNLRTILLLLIILLSSACSTLSINIANGLAKKQGSILNKDISYSENKSNFLDIYQPPRNNKLPNEQVKKPVIIFYYGGCWGACQSLKKNKYRFVAQALSSKGFIVVIADYRTYPQVRFKSIISDVARSVEWVKNNINKYGGDASKIYLMGHSSGAHLAATLISDRRYLKKKTYRSIKGFIGLAGAYDFYPFDQDYQAKVFAPEKNYRLSQPINFVSGKEPAMLLLYGDKDKIVKRRNIINMRNKVSALGGKVESKIYNDMGHVGLIASLSVPFQKSRPVLNDIVSFINKNL